MKSFRNQGVQEDCSGTKTAEVRTNPGRIYGRLAAGNSSRTRGLGRTVAVLKQRKSVQTPEGFTDA